MIPKTMFDNYFCFLFLEKKTEMKILPMFVSSFVFFFSLGETIFS